MAEPTLARLRAYDRFVKRCEILDIPERVDFMFLHAAADIDIAKISLFNPGTYRPRELGSPVFEADRGFKARGSGLSGTNLGSLVGFYTTTTASAPKFLQDDHCFGLFSLDDLGENAASMMGNQRCSINPKQASASTARIRGCTASEAYNDVAVSSSIGLFAVNRTVSTGFDFHNNTTYTPVTRTSAALTGGGDDSFWLVGMNGDGGDNQYSTRRLAISWAGRAWDKSMFAPFYAACVDYLTTVGAL
jgi:hypothetical protein